MMILWRQVIIMLETFQMHPVYAVKIAKMVICEVLLTY